MSLSLWFTMTRHYLFSQLKFANFLAERHGHDEELCSIACQHQHFRLGAYLLFLWPTCLMCFIVNIVYSGLLLHISFSPLVWQCLQTVVSHLYGDLLLNEPNATIFTFGLHHLCLLCKAAAAHIFNSAVMPYINTSLFASIKAVPFSSRSFNVSALWSITKLSSLLGIAARMRSFTISSFKPSNLLTSAAFN